MSTRGTQNLIQLLREALERVQDGELDRAAWRVADAGGRLRELIEQERLSPDAIIGMDGRTLAGFELPRRPHAPIPRVPLIPPDPEEEP